MLTLDQVQTVAYVAEDHGILHEKCARYLFSGLTIEKADAGLTTSGNVQPLIKYELSEIVGQYAEEHATETVGNYSDDPDAWQAAYDDYPNSYTCDHCGEEIEL